MGLLFWWIMFIFTLLFLLCCCFIMYSFFNHLRSSFPSMINITSYQNINNTKLIVNFLYFLNVFRYTLLKSSTQLNTLLPIHLTSTARRFFKLLKTFKCVMLIQLEEAITHLKRVKFVYSILYAKNFTKIRRNTLYLREWSNQINVIFRLFKQNWLDQTLDKTTREPIQLNLSRAEKNQAKPNFL